MEPKFWEVFVGFRGLEKVVGYSAATADGVYRLASAAMFLCSTLGDWPRNLGITFTILAPVLIALFNVFWLSTSFSIVVGPLVAFPIALLIACPFVCAEQAKAIAQEHVEKEKSGFRVTIGKAELDNWTWHVTGWVTSASKQSKPFQIDVNAKTGRRKGGLRWLS